MTRVCARVYVDRRATICMNVRRYTRPTISHNVRAHTTRYIHPHILDTSYNHGGAPRSRGHETRRHAQPSTRTYELGTKRGGEGSTERTTKEEKCHYQRDEEEWDEVGDYRAGKRRALPSRCSRGRGGDTKEGKKRGRETPKLKIFPVSSPSFFFLITLFFRQLLIISRLINSIENFLFDVLVCDPGNLSPSSN